MLGNRCEKIKQVLTFLPSEIKAALLTMDETELGKIREIRLSVGCPVMLYMDEVCFLNTEGNQKTPENAITATAAMVHKTVEKVCHGSVYSQQNEIKSGFLMMEGGHRVGVCGKAIVRDKKVDLITEISSVNIRIAGEVIGAADKIIKHIVHDGCITNTLIISPPLCGKTTVLRDIARQLAGGKYMFRTGIADERGEIAAMYKGEAQNDVGILSDIYDACPKSEAIIMLLRAMAPDVIITDEIGTSDDETAIKRIINAGVKIICSAHGFDRADVIRREGIGTLIKEGVFERIIVLSRREGAGTIERIY